MDDNSSCDICGQAVPRGSGYFVKIDVYADPRLEPMTSEQIASADFNGTLAQLMKQMATMSAEELQDGVHRSFNYHLCPNCHRSYLANPLGMPRATPVSTN